MENKLSESEQIVIRKNKFEELLKTGYKKYPNDFKPGNSVKELREKYEELPEEELLALGDNFSLAGRLMARRLFGKASFSSLKDFSGTIQLFFQTGELGKEEFNFYKKMVDVGDIVGVRGQLFKTKTGELTLNVKEFILLAKSFRPLPEKWHGLTDVESRYRQRYVDLIVNDWVKDVFLARNKVIKGVKKFLDERGFIEVETPMMHSIPGGAKAKPFITHHNTYDMDLYLRIAPELYLKRLVVGGLERVYELNRNFRNEGVSTHHNPEFTMIEFYHAYATYEDLMDLTEELFVELLNNIIGKTKIEYQGREIDFTPSWERIALKDSVIKYGNVPEDKINDKEFLKQVLKEKDVDTEGIDTVGELQTLAFEELVEGTLINPTFITKFPVEVSPLARRNDNAPDVTDRFELYIAGHELANAFSELNDPKDQLERFEKQLEEHNKGDEELPAEIDYDYVKALEYGLPPTAGEGIGIDRLVMLLTDQPSIREVILFPLLRKKNSL